MIMTAFLRGAVDSGGAERLCEPKAMLKFISLNDVAE
jgi:hypothetical protein